MNKLALKTKIVIVVDILFAISIAAVLFLSIRQARSKITEAMTEQFINEDKQIARQVEIILENGGDVEALQSFVTDLISKNSHIAYAVVVDTNVEAIAHSDTEKIGKSYADDTSYTVPASQQGVVMTSQFWADVQKAWTYDVMYPIYQDGKLFGSMDVGIYNSGVDSVVNGLKNVSIPMAIAVIVIISVVIFLVIKFLFNVFEDLIAFCNEISKGNLTIMLDNKIYNREDEIGKIAKSMANMRDSLKGLLINTSNSSSKIENIADKLNTTAEETKSKSLDIVDKSANVTESTVNQSDLTKRNATMVEEITKGMDNIAESIQHITEDSSATAKDAEEGNRQLMETVEQMNVIDQKVSVTYDKIQQLSDMSGTIEDVVKLIVDISGQTNLLALNASIEAARAGEQGKGFAVVAGEVGKLADESGVAAQKIASIINDIRSSIQESVALMDEGNKSVQQGIELTQKARDSFSGIKERIENVTQDITNVAAVTQEVSASTSNLCASMDQIADLAETVNSDTDEVSGMAKVQEEMMDEISGGVASLLDTVGGLKDSLSAFKLDETVV
ncbi:methyl-accepting chemotaxis protein [Butyrivibrio sp. MC2013]|uniref:methyl-accepting chemotaxis protein n=1 Tax=Butyrivibrio sp. MC2013 TaxID=1280686 RepID=UPI000416218D|nr:methyl-accepting chemotaxis protein [Butyrivibrio sp. MC2013]